ncbi:hypothetical protein GH5_06951 [Leishmania sp. Ghana 2012 LV757]|uniref:hypothetical protein n=1 Tax=Leishmania sp. Ghana 2012 LV757 TaxID=2803181 RepID=UPI001B6B8B2F|nr:hypothetical protein GH5_06951 [Leishmania sp. Ghana 2012 LV757]
MLRRRITASLSIGVVGVRLCNSSSSFSQSNSARCLPCATLLRVGGVLGATAPLRYVYKPPGSSEPSRLPWYQPVSSGSSRSATVLEAAAAAALDIDSSSATAMPSAAQGDTSLLHNQKISSILQAVDAAPTVAASLSTERASTNPTSACRKSDAGSAPSPAPAAAAVTAAAPSRTVEPRTAAARAPPAFSPSSLAASTQSTFSAAAALRRQDGALRSTPTRRMAAVSGPTLDARVEDIVKVEETLASELTLPKVVQLLIDPQAEGVERITMSEFVAMQPKRQLLALGGKREWQQWIEQSTYYQQAARLAAESPAQDLAALQQAGIQSLQQWLEHPQLVKVSARTRSALDTAVAQSVEAYMAEVVKVVNTSNQVEDVLSHWVSDVMGKFVLDSLQISVDWASQAMWAKRKDWMPADAVRNGGGGSPSTGTASSASLLGGDVTGRTHPQSVESRMLGEMLSGGGCSGASQSQQQSMLRPGEACTLDHYLRFVQKVISSVRQDYVASHAAMGATPGGWGDDQAEREITERSYGVIAAAFTQLLEQAVAHQLPPELQSLQQNGYLALDRVSGLLKRAGSLLQLRSVPVRYFVFHSSVDEATAVAATASHGRSSRADASLSGGAQNGLAVQAPPHYASGTFLTGSNRLDVTLGEWSGQPDPPSSTARESGGVVDDATEQEYLSVLHRLRRRVDTLAVTSLYEVIAQPERFGGNGFSAAEAIGLRQLFGPVKLLEDRLTTLLHYPPAAADKPIHFIEAGPLSGKTALLEQLAERTARPGDKVVLVRYGGSAMPYLPDLDDHPMAFAARFWFRVALASCPYLIRTEELYSRAPRSVYWWGHPKNWSWERYQSLLQSARNAGTGHRQHQQQQQQQQRGASSAAVAAPAQLASILVDDVDRALSAMQIKWGSAAAFSSTATQSAPGGSSCGRGGALAHSSSATRVDEGADDDAGEDHAGDGEDEDTPARAAAAAVTAPAAHSPSLQQQRQQAMSLWVSTGKSVEEHLYSCFTQISAAVGQVNFVFAGTAATPLLLGYCSAPCRRYYLPLSGGVGLQPRLRVLPLLATLHALHLTHRLDMPGLLYEVLKNAPALAGKALELFWSHRVSLMDLRTGLPRLMMGSGSAHPQLLHSYVPRELFAELPVYIALLQDPRRTRRRLVELLQRQLSSPTGYLSTELDTTPQDIKDGLVLPHNHTSSQVHPFALFAIFSRQDAIDERVFNSEGQLLEGSELQRGGDAEGEDGEGEEVNGSCSNAKPKAAATNAAAAAAAAAARLRSSTGVGSNERKVVRAWAEVWAEYRSVVSTLSTTPARKRDAMRILLHGALLLRSAAVAGAQLELNLKVPSFGFPLLASETRVRGSSAHHARGTAAAAGESLIRSATPDTVRRAVSAYKMFFSNAAPSHFPFRPMVGLNGGCDVVFVCGSTLALYSIVTTTAQLRHMVARFAEALLGVLHVLERQVLPADKVRAVQYVTVVSLDEARPGMDASLLGNGSSGSHTGVYARRRGAAVAGGVSVDVFNTATAPTVPYYLDYDAVFEDDVMDRLRELQRALSITKDFRTLSELINEIERTHRVRVLHDVVATPEEVESLFSPTLLQLVPDSTVLPAYTSAVVSAADLMVQAMNRGAGARRASDVAADEDDDADYVNMGEDDVVPGAELDDLASDARLLRDASAGKSAAGGIGPSDSLHVADGDLVHESAALLEAMMNDELDSMTNWSAQLQQQREETARDLQRDLVMEDRINYNAPPPSIGMSAADAAYTRVPPPSAGGAASLKSSRAPARSAAEDAEADALAWLHDVITPESLIAGLQGSNPGAQASAPPYPSTAAAAPGAAAHPQGTASVLASTPLAAAGGSPAFFAGSIANPAGPWTPNPILSTALASAGAEVVSAAPPRATSKRDGSGISDGGASSATDPPAATAPEGKRGEGEAAAGDVAETDDKHNDSGNSGEEDDVEGDEESRYVGKSRNPRGSRRKGGSRDSSKASAAASRQPRRESHGSRSGKRAPASTRQRQSASSRSSNVDRAMAKSTRQSDSQAKRRKSLTFADAPASAKKSTAASASSSSRKKKPSSSRRK